MAEASTGASLWWREPQAIARGQRTPTDQSLTMNAGSAVNSAIGRTAVQVLPEDTEEGGHTLTAAAQGLEAAATARKRRDTTVTVIVTVTARRTEREVALARSRAEEGLAVLAEANEKNQEETHLAVRRRRDAAAETNTKVGY